VRPALAWRSRYLEERTMARILFGPTSPSATRGLQLRSALIEVPANPSGDSE
jgi:hypothetical protein